VSRKISKAPGGRGQVGDVADRSKPIFPKKKGEGRWATMGQQTESEDRKGATGKRKR